MRELQPDDPRYTAYALGELTPKDQELITDRVQGDAELIEESVKTQALGRLLAETYETQNLPLHPVQRTVAKRVDQKAQIRALRNARRRKEWFWTVSVITTAAAAVIFALFVLSQTKVSSGPTSLADASPEQLQLEVVLGPAALVNWGGAFDGGGSSETPSDRASAGDRDKSEVARKEFTERILNDPQRFFASAELTARQHHLPAAESFIPLQENDYLSSSENARTTVPVMAGRTSFAWVERFLRERGQLPPRDAVRLEELVNYPDYQEHAQAKVGGVALTSELVPCPWNPDCLLLGLLLQRDPGTADREEVAVQLSVDQERVAEYRLLGFAQPDGEIFDGADASHPLAAGNSTYVFYEIRPNDFSFDETSLGKVALRVSGQFGISTSRQLDVPAIPSRWLDSSNSFRTAATVAAYALCLRDSPYKGSLNFEWVESLARRTLLEHPEADSATKEVLELIIETRMLAGL